MNKIIFWIGFVFIVLLGAGVWILSLNANEILRQAVIEGGPELTQTDIQLEDIDLSLLGGRAEMRGLVIGNPEGSFDPAAFSLREVKLALDPWSLMEDVIHIEEIIIRAPLFNCEWTGGKSCRNFEKLQSNIEEELGPMEDQTGKKSQGKDVKVIIDHILIEDAKIDVVLTKLKNKRLTLDLPKVELEDLGTKEGGISAETAASILTKHLTQKVVAYIGPIVIKSLAEDVILDNVDAVTKGTLGEVEKKAKGFLGEILGKTKSEPKPK